MRNFAERDLVENNITDKADATGLLEITSIYPVTQCNNFAKIFMFISYFRLSRSSFFPDS